MSFSLILHTHSLSHIYSVFLRKKNLGFYSCLCCFLLCSSSHRSLQSQSDLGFTAQTLKTIMLSPRLQRRDWITRGTSCFSCSLPFSSCTLNSHSCLVPLGAVPAQQSCGVPAMCEPATGTARAASLKLVLCARVLRDNHCHAQGHILWV